MQVLQGTHYTALKLVCSRLQKENPVDSTWLAGKAELSKAGDNIIGNFALRQASWMQAQLSQTAV